MAKLVLLRQGSRRILVESDTAVTQSITKALGQTEGVVPGMEPTSAIDDIKAGLEDVKALIVETADTLYEAIGNLAGSPSKVTAEFGIKFAGEAGFAVITKVSAEAQLRVSVEWTPRRS